MEDIHIKEWFLTKNFNENERYAISVSEISVKKESEKAVYVYFTSDYGTIKSWIPKSCLATKEEIEAERKLAEERDKAIIKYHDLLMWASKQGLKVGNMPKKVNLLKKIEKAGLQVPEELL